MSQWLLHFPLASAAKPVPEAWASSLSPHQFASSSAIPMGFCLWAPQEAGLQEGSDDPGEAEVQRCRGGNGRQIEEEHGRRKDSLR